MQVLPSEPTQLWTFPAVTLLSMLAATGQTAELSYHKMVRSPSMVQAHNPSAPRHFTTSLPAQAARRHWAAT